MMTTEATPKTPPLMEKPAWKALGEHYQNMRNVAFEVPFCR